MLISLKNDNRQLLVRALRRGWGWGAGAFISSHDTALRQPLIGAVDEELLSVHVAALLDKGLPSLLEAPPRLRELRLLFTLVGRVGGLGHLKAGLGAYVRRAGTALMLNQDRDKDMVEVRACG
jgi:cullin-4